MARFAATLLLAATLLFSLAMAWNTDGWPVYIAEAPVFSLTGITAARAMATGKIQIAWPVFLLCAACVWIVVQLCCRVSVYAFGTFRSLLEWLSLACVFWSSLQLFESSTSVRGFRTLLIVIGAATAAFSIVYMHTSNGRVYWVIGTADTWQPMGPFLNADHNAVFMEMLLPLAVWESLQRVHKGYLYAVAAAVMYGSVIVGASRASIVLATLEFVLLLLYSIIRSRLYRRMVVAASFLVVCVLGMAVMADWSTVFRRFQAEDVFQQRRELLQSTVQMTGEHPLTGSGMGTWAIVYPRFALFEPGLSVRHAHNEWAEWMAEGGVPFVLLLWTVVIRTVLLIRKFPWGLGIAAAALHAFVDFPFHVYPDLLCFFVIISLMETDVLQSRTGDLVG